MSRPVPGRDIGPDEDRPGQLRHPHHQQLARSAVGGPITSPSDDLVEQSAHQNRFSHPGQRILTNGLHNNDLEEDTADPLHARSWRPGMRGQPGYICEEPVDTSTISEAEVYASVFPQRQRPPVTGEHYKSEEIRLQTFRDWPRRAPVRKEDLARNGFIYTGSSDKVRCIYCNGVLRHWEQGDDVEQEHQRTNPHCPFICGEDVGNIPFQPTVNGHHSGPAGMSAGGNRGFEQQQEAGYDIGPNEDRCSGVRREPIQRTVNGWTNGFHQCGSGVGGPGSRNVANSDQVQSFRASEQRVYSSRPQNPAMAAEPDRLATFEFWPAQMRQRPKELAQAGLYYIGDSDKVKCFHCDGLLYNWEPEDDPFVEHARWFPQCQYVHLIRGNDFVNDVQSGRVQQDSVMQTPAVLAVLAEGRTPEQVQQAILALKQREGSNVVITAPKLLEAVLELEIQQMNISPSRHISDSLSSAGMETLQRENESLRDKQLCKICMERDVEVIFYPCKHFVCCAMCGAAVSTCPICRQPIQSVDKVFMA